MFDIQIHSIKQTVWNHYTLEEVFIKIWNVIISDIHDVLTWVEQPERLNTLDTRDKILSLPNGGGESLFMILVLL